MDFLILKELPEPKKLKSAVFLLYLLYSKLPRRVTREKSPQGLKESVTQKETGLFSSCNAGCYPRG